MKNIKKNGLLCFFALMVGALVSLVSSCSNEDKMPDFPQKKANKISVFNKYGRAHNAMLTYAEKNFFAPMGTFSKDEKIDYVLKLQTNGVKSLNITEEEKKFLCENMSKYKNLFVMSDVISKIETRSSDDVSVSTPEIIQLIESSYKEGAIDRFEYDTFLELVVLVERNYSGKISNIEFEDKVSHLITKWEIKYANVDYSVLEQKDETYNHSKELVCPDGALAGVVLNVSKNSLDFWTESEENLNATRSVSAFVGCDIAGAVISACLNGAYQYHKHNKIEDVNSILWSATTGAIVGSTGVVGKIGGWIASVL